METIDNKQSPDSINLKCFDLGEENGGKQLILDHISISPTEYYVFTIGDGQKNKTLIKKTIILKFVVSNYQKPLMDNMQSKNSQLQKKYLKLLDYFVYDWYFKSFEISSFLSKVPYNINLSISSISL